MSRVPPHARTGRAQQLESLLADLGSRVTRGGRTRESSARALSVGRTGVDRLLGGGFPLGALSEVSGAASSGRTSLVLSLLANVTARGELAGWVDGADAFDPASAERRGVDLDRVLWVRTPSWRETLHATEQLVRTDGFPLVLVDGSAALSPPAGQSHWLRLARLAAASHKALLLLSRERLAGAHAALAIEMQPARPRFTGTPPLLEELETRMVLARNRAAPIDPGAAHPVQTRPSKPHPPHESAA